MSALIKYSVIIPVYNREMTIARCLKSLVSQNREDIQILVIDDGSQDASGQVVQEFALRYPCIWYHHQQNSGVSCARNVGLDHAVGQYVTFVDSDDYVSPDYFSVLDQELAEHNCDMLVFRKEGFGASSSPDEANLFSRLKQLSTDYKRLELLLSSRLIMPPFNKCFKNEQIQSLHLRFVEGLHIGEDFTFCMMYAMHCSSIAVSSSLLYYCDLSDQTSLSRKYRPNLDRQMVQVFHHVDTAIRTSNIYCDHLESLSAVADYLYIKNVCTCIAEEFKNGKGSYFRYRDDFASICRSFKQPISNTYCGIIHRVMRQLLSWNCFFPFFAVSFLVKGRKLLNRKE